jgi:hypothetical protein
MFYPLHKCNPVLISLSSTSGTGELEDGKGET